MTAERRLLEHLEDLRRHPPQPGDELVAAVVRSARWQGALRPYLVAAGGLLGAIATSARLAGGRR